MENASKALLMAGGVLIAIIVISLLIVMYGKISEFQKQNLSSEEVVKIEQYNKQFTKYLDQYVYGTEVITTVNKVVNTKSDYEITLDIEFYSGGYTYRKISYENGIKVEKDVTIAPGDTITLKNGEGDYIFINSTTTSLVELKSRAFKCTDIKFGDDGRVNYIKFVEKQYT